jgi:Bacterial Ig domain
VFGANLATWDTTGFNDGEYILKLVSYDIAGNKGVAEHSIVLDRQAPDTPIVNAISDASSMVSGNSEAGSQISIYKGSIVIGKGMADLNGQFTIVIPKQSAGTILRLRATDVAGNVSLFKESLVMDKTPPSIPTVNPLYNYHTSVTGKTSPNSKMELWYNSKVVARGTANSYGLYTIVIQKQDAGKVFYVKAVDAAGNRSAGTKVTVLDKIAPMTPTVPKIYSSTTTVSGKAEAGSYIYIKKGTSILKSTVTKTNGVYSLTIPKQKRGTYLVFYSKDNAGNLSKSITVRVL